MKKIICVLLTFALCLACLTGCGDKKEEEVITIWGPLEHQDVYLEYAQKFVDEHPEFEGVTIKFADLGDAGANGNVSKDVESAAEIYTFPNDQMLTLIQMGTLGVLPEDKVDYIKNNHYAAAGEACMFDGEYYAYPVTADNGFVFIYNKDAFTGTSVWDETKDGLKDGYTFRDLFKALDEKAEMDPKWENALCAWPVGTAWYQCGVFFAVDADYKVEFNSDYEQVSSECNFTYDVVADGTEDYTKGIEALNCMVNTFTNEDGTINKHFVYADDNNYNSIANNLSLPGEFDKEDGTPLAGMVCWNNASLYTNWGENYACDVLPTLVASSKQFGGSGESYTWRTFAGYKLMGVNPYSQYAKKSPEHLMRLHDLAEYLCSTDVSLARFKASNCGPSDLVARENPDVATNPFVAALNKQMEIVDKFGNLGCRTQDCVPQNLWTPIATYGTGVFEYVNSDKNAASYNNENGLQRTLKNLQYNISKTN